jgi:hypothetical protein
MVSSHIISVHTQIHTQNTVPNSLTHSLTQPLTPTHILTQSLAQPLIHPHIHSLTVFSAIFEDDGGRIWTQGGLQTADLDETFQTR